MQSIHFIVRDMNILDNVVTRVGIASICAISIVMGVMALINVV